MKITKDSLLAENATLKATIAELEKKIEDGKEANKSVRQDISAALGAGTTKEYSYSDPKSVVWSWSQIFVEIGKLLEKKDYADFTYELRSLDHYVRDFAGRFEGMDTDKPPFRKSND